MSKKYLYSLYIVTICWVGLAQADTIKKIAPSPNGIDFPAGYQNWQTISVSHRIDNNTIRTILGNPIAIQAARKGKTNPWPDGAILAKVAWKQESDENWPAAIIPAEFHQVEFMLKDAKKYSASKGWGYARWRGKDLKPWGENADFSQGCVACHTPVAHRDYVYSTPAIFIDGEK